MQAAEVVGVTAGDCWKRETENEKRKMKKKKKQYKNPTTKTTG
jgi:hypothetical protein